MSKKITDIKLEVEFDRSFTAEIRLEDMDLDIRHLHEFLVTLKEPIEKLSQRVTASEAGDAEA